MGRRTVHGPPAPRRGAQADWAALRNGTAKPPYVPKSRSPAELMAPRGGPPLQQPHSDDLDAEDDAVFQGF